MVNTMTTRRLFNGHALYSGNKILKKTYTSNRDGSDHPAATAFEETVKILLMSNEDVKPWKSRIPLPKNFPKISTIEGLKDAEADQPEVS